MPVSPRGKALGLILAIATLVVACSPVEDPATAIPRYTQTLAANPTDLTALVNRCAHYTTSAQYENAVADCTEALRLQPNNADARQNRAVAYQRWGRLEQALADWQQFLAQIEGDEFWRTNSPERIEYARQQVAALQEQLKVSPEIPTPTAQTRSAEKQPPARFTPSLPSVTPEEVGLDWQECQVPNDYGWLQVVGCFHHPMPIWDNIEKGSFAEEVELDNWQLAIGQARYQASRDGSGLSLKSCYTLSRDGIPLSQLCGEFTTYSPNVTLQNIGGKAAWEFADQHLRTVIYDGVDIQQRYGLDAAYRPYQIADKMIFVGEKDGHYFVVYDGKRAGPLFDKIMIAYCCEPVAWSVQYGQGRYIFWGERDGQTYVVEVREA